MTVTIAPLNGEVLSAAHRIHQQAQPRPWSMSTFEDCTKAPYAGLVAFEDGHVVAYAILLFVVDEATLMDIAVKPSVRGKGVASVLMDDVIAMCKLREMRSLWLEVRVNNPVAIALYEKYQFEHIETRKNYYDTDTGKVDALIMKRDIDVSHADIDK